MQLQTTIQARRPAPIAAHSAHFEGRASAAVSHMLFGSPELTSIAITYDRNAEIYGRGRRINLQIHQRRGSYHKVSTMAAARSNVLPAWRYFGLDSRNEHLVSQRSPAA
jgi:hypothetical protein